MVLVKAGPVASGGAPTHESKRGSDCAGTTGTINRTLDLTGVSTSEIVLVQGAYYTPTVDYTKATVGAVSQLTFVNKIYDNFYIEIYWWA